jgi:hypothetical protein
LIKRIIIDVDLDKLTFSDLTKTSNALAYLESLGTLELLSFSVRSVVGNGSIPKLNGERKSIQNAKLNPSAVRLLKALDEHNDPMTAQDLATISRIKPASVRAHLNTFLKRGYVRQTGKAESDGGRASLLWQIIKAEDKELDA